MNTLKEIREMWLSEVKPLIEELELRENRRNRIDYASMICEIKERFELTITNSKQTSE